MDSPVKERLRRYIAHSGLSERQFCLSIGVSTSFVANISKSIQPDKVNRISKQFPELNMGWVLTGEGEMLNNLSVQNTEESESNVIKAILLTLEMQRESNRKLMEQMDRILKTNEDLVNNNRVLTEIISKRGLVEDASGAAGMAAVAVQG